jgi:hypothetical protein
LKSPLKYKNQIIGYIEDIIYVDGIIKTAQFYLFDNQFYEEIVDNIKRSTLLSLDNNPNSKNKYEFELKDDLLTIRLKI